MENKNFEQLINDLKNLKKFSPPNNFEFKLQTKLQNPSVEKPTSYNGRRLFPAFALGSILILLFIFFRPFAENYEDPLQIQPQIREDIIVYSENEIISNLTEYLNDSFKENDSNTQKSQFPKKANAPDNFKELNNNLSLSQQYRLNISKAEFNFTRPVISEEEFLQVQILKQKFQHK
jgi:hypothetical protein